MSGLIVSLQQGSPEWHSWRLSGIGGSDAPVIDSTSPYKTPLQLAREKLGLDTEGESGNEYIFSLGHKTETLIRRQFQEHIGVEVTPLCMQHSKDKHRLMSFDGFDSKLGSLEAKLVGREVLKSAIEKGEIPDHHFTQIQHGLEVSGADVGQWFGHDGKKDGALITIERDQNFIVQMKDLEDEFWFNLKSGKLPDLTDRDYLRPEDETLLVQLRDAKELAENAEIAFEALKKKVIEKFRHPKIAGAGLKVFKVERAGTLNLTDIPEVVAAKESLDPNYVESFRKKGSESWTVKIDLPKKAKA